MVFPSVPKHGNKLPLFLSHEIRHGKFNPRTKWTPLSEKVLFSGKP